jgi:PHP family Zn ribbon phosphoesterase
MEDIVWLFLALIVALVALGAVLTGLLRRAPQIKTDHCPSCRTPMSLRRVSLLKSHAILGEWECPHCGNRIKSGKRVSETAA